MYDVCNGTGTTTATLTLTVGTGTGAPQGAAVNDLVVVCTGASGGPSQSVTSVADSKANTYAAQVADSTSANTAAMWTSKITSALVSGTDTITITWSSASGQKQGIVKGASGVSSATADQAVHASATSTAPDSGPTGVLAQASELVVGVICNANAGKAPTALSSGGTGTTAQSGSGEYLTQFAQSVSATTSLDMSGTIISANWCALAATFRLAGSGLAITSLTPPSGTVGTAYNAGAGYTLTATGGTSPFTWSVPSGIMPPGISLNPGGSGGHACGVTIAQVKTLAALEAAYTTWQTAAPAGLGLYTPVAKKIYFTTFPINATVALWKSANVDVGQALDQGMGMYLCYKPTGTGTFNDPAWPGGAIFPSAAQQATDYGSKGGSPSGLAGSVQSIVSACTSAATGASVKGVILYQENDNKSNEALLPSPFQASYQYKAFYDLLKRDFPTIDVIVCYVNFPKSGTTAAQDATDRTQRFPGPSPLNPAGWGDGRCYCDGVATDAYCEDFDKLDTTNRLRYIYAEPSLYTPASGSTPASGNPGWGDIAAFNNVKWGNTETGNSAANNAPPPARVQNYLVGSNASGGTSNPVPLTNGTVTDANLHSMLASYQTAIALGNGIIPMMWYMNGTGGTGPDPITASSDARIPWLNMIDAATAQATTGLINGTPTTSNGSPFAFTLKVKDASGTTATAGESITISAGTPTLTVTTPAGALPSGVSAQAYGGTTLAASGGTGTGFTWAIHTGTLSGSGLTLNSSGTISGTDATVGSDTVFTFTATVTDSGSNTANSGTYTLTILAPGVTVTETNTSPLPGGTTGVAYADTLTATGGTGPYTYALAPGSNPLPPGLSIDNSDPVDDEALNPITDEGGSSNLS